MLTFISVALGVMVGILLSIAVVCMVMLNPTVAVWLTNKYMSAMEKIMKNFENKMGV